MNRAESRASHCYLTCFFIGLLRAAPQARRCGATNQHPALLQFLPLVNFLPIHRCFKALDAASPLGQQRHKCNKSAAIIGVTLADGTDKVAYRTAYVEHAWPAGRLQTKHHPHGTSAQGIRCK